MKCSFKSIRVLPAVIIVSLIYIIIIIRHELIIFNIVAFEAILEWIEMIWVVVGVVSVLFMVGVSVALWIVVRCDVLVVVERMARVLCQAMSVLIDFMCYYRNKNLNQTLIIKFKSSLESYLYKKRPRTWRQVLVVGFCGKWWPRSHALRPSSKSELCLLCRGGPRLCRWLRLFLKRSRWAVHRSPRVKLQTKLLTNKLMKI